MCSFRHLTTYQPAISFRVDLIRRSAAQNRMRNISVFSQYWAGIYVAFMSIKPYEMMPLQRFKSFKHAFTTPLKGHSSTNIIKYSFTQIYETVKFRKCIPLHFFTEPRKDASQSSTKILKVP